MKAYMIAPTFEMYGVEDDRTRAVVQMIAKMVFDCLRSDGDTFQFAVDWADPGDVPGGPISEDLAEPHIVPLQCEDALLDRLHQAVDPNCTGGGDVRSIATCRSCTFGWDGQAFLCLRHEDRPPVSPDPNLVMVEERSDLLSGSDYFDGWTRDTQRSSNTR
jgi:hypothetical protein